MTAARPILSIVSLILVAGAALLQFFTILSGAITSVPINQFYFLEAANIAAIPGARNPSRWTFFAICGVGADGNNANCGSPVPALPFDPPRNFGTEEGVPEGFLGTNEFYYLSRFMFAFFLISLFFSSIGLFTGLMALFSRLGGYISGLTAAIALFFQALAASLMTAWTILGRNAFRAAGYEATLGVKLYGFAWASFAALLIATVLFFTGGAIGGHSSYGGDGVERKRSTRSNRSRGSFFDGGRKERDDYS